MNVLIVDDDSINRRVLKVVLEREGHLTREAGDGMEAWEMLEKEPADMVISDILMPRKDGYQLCYELRRHRRFKTIPIVLYSSTYTSPANEKLALGFGADKFLKKPAPAKILLETVNELWNRPAPAAPEPEPVSTEELLETREYSTSLIHQLEEQNVMLEQTREQITQTNKHLLDRTRELEQAQSELEKVNAELERRVEARTMELEDAFKALESFSYSVSHDLRAPVRAIAGFSKVLAEDCGEKLSADEYRYLKMIQRTTDTMNGLINGLLELSRVTRVSPHRVQVDLTSLAEAVAADLRSADPERSVKFRAEPGMTVSADRVLLHTVLQNLLGNAWKYTGKTGAAEVEMGVKAGGDEQVFFVRDNGAGFDMKHVGRLFNPFQRLHPADEFPGSGIGLATVQRIIRRHGGRIWTEAAPEQGATFYFTLGPG